jgi:hypothetical protein
MINRIINQGEKRTSQNTQAESHEKNQSLHCTLLSQKNALSINNY